MTQEFPLWLNSLKTQYTLCEDVGSIPGLAQWIKEPPLPKAVAYMLQMWLGFNVAMPVA